VNCTLYENIILYYELIKFRNNLLSIVLLHFLMLTIIFKTENIIIHKAIFYFLLLSINQGY